MWEPYLKRIRENCSESLHILDRFHIVAKMNKALDNVRAEETSRMKREGRAPVLKKSRSACLVIRARSRLPWRRLITSAEFSTPNQWFHLNKY